MRLDVARNRSYSTADTVMIPSGVTTVFIEAHDKVHLWSLQRLEVDLRKVIGGRLKVEAD